MQIEVSATRVIDMLAAKLGKKEAEIARLEATNEVLMERLREHVERDRSQTTNGQANGQLPFDPNSVSS